MHRVVFNQKGGVGKTSITCNLAAIGAHRGRRTLVIDLDPQANSSHYLLGEQNFSNSMADYLDQTAGFFSTKRTISEFIVPTPFSNLSVIPANNKLPEIEHKLESRYKIFEIKKALKELSEHYDDIYLDTPPAFNFFTKSALIGAQRVLIPFDCDAFSRQSLDVVSTAINDICEDHNPSLCIEGIVVNQFQPRASLPQQLVNELIESGHPILATMLSSSVKMRESHQHAKPLIYLAPKHNLTQQFEALYNSLTNEA